MTDAITQADVRGALAELTARTGVDATGAVVELAARMGDLSTGGVAAAIKELAITLGVTPSAGTAQAEPDASDRGEAALAMKRHPQFFAPDAADQVLSLTSAPVVLSEQRLYDDEPSIKLTDSEVEDEVMLLSSIDVRSPRRPSERRVTPIRLHQGTGDQPGREGPADWRDTAFHKGTDLLFRSDSTPAALEPADAIIARASRNASDVKQMFAQRTPGKGSPTLSNMAKPSGSSMSR